MVQCARLKCCWHASDLKHYNHTQTEKPVSKSLAASLSTTSRLHSCHIGVVSQGNLAEPGIKPSPTAWSTGSCLCYSDPVFHSMFCMHDHICLVVKGERKTENGKENTITCVLVTIADIYVCTLFKFGGNSWCISIIDVVWFYYSQPHTCNK